MLTESSSVLNRLCSQEFPNKDERKGSQEVPKTPAILHSPGLFPSSASFPRDIRQEQLKLSIAGAVEVSLLIAQSLFHNTHAVYGLPPLVPDRNSSTISIVPCCYQQTGVVKEL